MTEMITGELYLNMESKALTMLHVYSNIACTLRSTMWCYLDKTASFLEKVASVYRLIPLEEQLVVKREFRGVMRGRTRSNLLSLRRPKLRSNSSGIPNIIGCNVKTCISFVLLF